MKLSLNWLKDYVPLKLSVDELVKRLTMAGMEIEGVETIGEDTVLDLEITPNRADCLSLWGLAREVAAVTDQRVFFPKIRKLGNIARKCDVTIEDKESCRRYVGVVIRDIHVKRPEEKIRKRMESVGLRAINNVVDVTNFLLMETGQPMHAFDLDKLEGGKIIVRKARAGEKIVTLDGEERQLDPSILVIADAVKPVAIAGIKGGKSAEVDWETKNILLESAWFDPVLIRRTSRKLKLASDSSYRFERGVDYAMVTDGASRAADLILQTAGGKIAAYRDVQASRKFGQSRRVSVSLAGVEKRLGASIGSVKFRTYLKTLGCETKSGKSDIFSITIPSFRRDLQRDVDFDEEVARLIGYDHIPSTLPTVPLNHVPSDPAVLRKRIVRTACLGMGLDEVVCFSTLPEEDLNLTKINGQPDLLRIANPLSAEQAVMRPSSLPSLLKVLRTNFNNGQKHVRFFEIGKVYGQNIERGVLSFLLTGASDHDWRSAKASGRSFYDLKGSIENVFRSLRISVDEALWTADRQEPFMDPEQTARIVVKEKNIGLAGRLNDAVLRAWDIKAKDVWFAELDLDWLCSRPSRRPIFNPLSEFPAIIRDISLSIPDGTTFKNLCDDIARHKIDILRLPVVLKDEYHGEGVAAGRRALTISLKYQSAERTLTEEEVDKVHTKVVESLAQQLGAVQR